MAAVRMNLEFLEKAYQFLPSLEWCSDKSSEADETLTATLPLNTLAQPDTAAKTHPHSTHRLHKLHTGEETDLFVLANKFTPTSPNISPLSHTRTHAHTLGLEITIMNSPPSCSSSWCRGVSWLSQWRRRERSTGGSCEAGRPRLCQTPASDPTEAQSKPSPPSWSPPYRAARCHGANLPGPPATNTQTLLIRYTDRSTAKLTHQGANIIVKCIIFEHQCLTDCIFLCNLLLYLFFCM